MSVRYKHYVVIGEKITRKEADRRLPDAAMQWELADLEEIIFVNMYSGDTVIVVDEIIQADFDVIQPVDLPALLEKYSPERIHIFTKVW